ncbi:hypothetical protein KXW36_000523, partial [Aspergillus fumigatus]
RPECCPPDRRRHADEIGRPHPGRGSLHPWFLGAADGMAAARHGKRRPGQMQHFRCDKGI